MNSDVIVIGAGHNSLIAAAYLAEAGLSVTVLESRNIIGGNTTSEELTLPGFHHDSCSSAHVVIQSNPLIRNDELKLIAKYGLEYLVTDPAVVIPLGGDESLIIHPDVEKTAKEFEKYSVTDAQALRVMMDDWDRGLRVSHAHYQAGLPLPENEWSERYQTLRAKSAWQVVMETFENSVIRQAMIWMSFATIQPPERLGTGALPAAIISGRLKFGWTTPVGGSIALPLALSRHIADHGGEVLLEATAEHLIVEKNKCVGVITADGREFRSRYGVVTGSHLKTLPSMLNEPTPMINRAASLWRPGLAVFAVHFALMQEVSYRSENGAFHAVAGGLGSPEGLRRQVNAALDGRIDISDPWLLMVASTVVDPKRAPGGAFKFLTIAPTLKNGIPWRDEDATSFALQLVKHASEYVSGLEPENILMMRAESPTSLATHNIANISGSCHGGEFVMEDGSIIPGWLDYRTDLTGLYLTGSTSHPGGSVSGRPGRNAARTVLDDLGIDSTKVISRP